MRSTPALPKYSLMMSVVTNTTGQMSTPAVRLPGNPISLSAEKILTPMISASSAFTRKMPLRTR